jgi:hypothetical protein
LIAPITLKLALSLAVAATGPLAARAALAEKAPTPGAADPGAVGGETPRAGEDATRLKLRTQLDALYTSNLFHVQDRRTATFDSHLDPGQRFYGMSSISDLILQPGARASLDVPLGRKRDVELGLGADYHLHQRNGIADYLKLSATGAFDLARHDTAAVEAKYVPRRFEKNHRRPDGEVNLTDPAAATLAPFEHAYARELALTVRYDRKWSHAIATQLEYVNDRTEYDDPFHNRDEIMNEGRAALVLDVGARSTVEVGGGFGVSTSPGGREVRHGVELVVDRSFRETSVFGAAHLSASKAVALDADLEIRNRDYTTNVGADTTYFQRSDRRIRLELDVTRKVGSGLSLKAFGGLTRNYSNRVDPNLAPEDAGYMELVLGIAANWRFSTGHQR